MATSTPWKFWTHDERLAWEYLSGREVNGPDGWSLQYFDPGSPQEAEARAALVRVLQGQERDGVLIKDEILGRLASLFAPTGPPPNMAGHPLHIASMFETRELVVRNRNPGVQPDHVRDVKIAEEVARKVTDGVKVEAAIQEAMVRFKVTRPTAFRAWKAHGEPFLVRNAVYAHLESPDPDSLK